jgi:hypothetical protein
MPEEETRLPIYKTTLEEIFRKYILCARKTDARNQRPNQFSASDSCVYDPFRIERRPDHEADEQKSRTVCEQDVLPWIRQRLR